MAVNFFPPFNLPQNLFFKQRLLSESPVSSRAIGLETNGAGSPNNRTTRHPESSETIKSTRRCPIDPLRQSKHAEQEKETDEVTHGETGGSCWDSRGKHQRSDSFSGKDTCRSSEIEGEQSAALKLLIVTRDLKEASRRLNVGQGSGCVEEILQRSVS